MEALDFGFPVEIIREGDAEVVVPKLEAYKRGRWDYAPSKAPVFYNPRMKICRDIAILVLQSYRETVSRGLNVSEPLAGCGVRGIRFAKEVEDVESVYINDINEKACQMARYNAQLNGLEEKIFVSNEDANLFLSKHAAPKKRFDFIDIDPFGSPTSYLDSAVRALRDGGLIALTATDMAPLCGVYPKVALRKYGGLSLRTEYSHEIAIRLLAGCLATTAARHNVGIEVIFSHSTQHYARLYALVKYGSKKADEALENMGYILHCFKCFHRETYEGILLMGREMKCPECGSLLKVAGPLWLGKIADKGFCARLEERLKKSSLACISKEAAKLTSLIRNESSAPITYYVIDKICDKNNLPVPPLKGVIDDLIGMGYEASETHFHSRGLKTNAPATVVTEVIKKVLRGRHRPNFNYI